ncbi:MAG: Gfo/Idh/MocA family oxidoreductase, partial [Octadecabacter sp.]
SGKLGNLGLVEIAVPLWRGQDYYNELGRGTYERDCGGVLLTQAIHSIDLALNLTGPVSTVRATTTATLLRPMASEDFVVAGLRLASGAIGSLLASTVLVVNWRDGIQQIVPPDPQGSGEAHLAGAT